MTRAKIITHLGKNEDSAALFSGLSIWRRTLFLWSNYSMEKVLALDHFIQLKMTIKSCFRTTFDHIAHHQSLRRAALLGFMLLAAATAQASSHRENQMLLFDFTDKDDLQDWRVVNDGVMGGLSQGGIVLTDSNTAVFQGILSLKNNGGFSSARTLPRPFNLDSYAGLTLRVRGDGKQYQLRLRQDDRFDGVAYRFRFQTIPDEWITIEVAFSACVPVFRGRELQDVNPLSPAKIQQLGFLISDGQAGPFRLEVDWISAHGQ